MKIYACFFLLKYVASAVFDTADINPQNDINSQVGNDIELSVSLKAEQLNNGCTVDKVKIYVKGQNLTELATQYNETTLVLRIENAQISDSGFYMIVCDGMANKKSFLGARYVNIMRPPSPVTNFECFSANWVEMECSWTVPPGDSDHDTQHILYYSVFDYPALVDKNLCPSYHNRRGYHSYESLPGAPGTISSSAAPVDTCRFVNKPSAILSAAAGDPVLLHHQNGGHLEFFPDWTYYFVMVSKNAIGIVTQNFTAKPKDIVKPDPPKCEIVAGTINLTLRIISGVTVSPNGVPLLYTLHVTSPHVTSSPFYTCVFAFNASTTGGGHVISETRPPHSSPLTPTLRILGTEGVVRPLGRAVVLEGLLPYLPYEVEIRAKPLANGFLSEPNTFTVSTLEMAPEVIPETSVSGFELARSYTENNNKITVYWKSVARAFQFGPDFHYNLYDGDEVVALNLTNNFYSVQLEGTDVAVHSFRVTAANTMGQSSPSKPVPFCQKHFLSNPQNVRIIHYSGTAYTLAWNNAKSMENVKAYTIYWCKTHKYIPFTCGPDIEWVSIGADDTRIHSQRPAEKNATQKLAFEIGDRPDRDVLTYNLTLDTNFLAGIAYESASPSLASQGIVWGLCVLKYPQKPKAPKLNPHSWKALSSRTLKIEWTKEACQSEGGPVAFYELYHAPVQIIQPYASDNFVTTNLRSSRSFGTRLANKALNFTKFKEFKETRNHKIPIASHSVDSDYVDDVDKWYTKVGLTIALTGIPYGNSTYAILTDLEPDTPYMVWMKALSLANLYSQSSLRVIATTMEDVPSDSCDSLALTRLNESHLHISWNLPTTPNGKILYSQVNVTQQPAAVESAPPAPSIFYKVLEGALNNLVLPVQDLEGNTVYNFDVVACNSIGCSPPRSDPLEYRTDVREPSVMDAPEYTLLDQNRVLITWNPPKRAHGPINYYDILLYRENDSHLQLLKSYTVLQGGMNEFSLTIDCSPHKRPNDSDLDKIPVYKGPPKYYVSLRAVNRDPSNGVERAGPYTEPKLIANVCYHPTLMGQGVSIQSQQRKIYVITGSILCSILILLLLYFTTGVNRQKLVLLIRNMELKATLPWDEEEYQRFHLENAAGNSFSDLLESGPGSSYTNQGRGKRWTQPSKLEKISNIDLYLIKDGQPKPSSVQENTSVNFKPFLLGSSPYDSGEDIYSLQSTSSSIADNFLSSSNTQNDVFKGKNECRNNICYDILPGLSSNYNLEDYMEIAPGVQKGPPPLVTPESLSNPDFYTTLEPGTSESLLEDHRPRTLNLFNAQKDSNVNPHTKISQSQSPHKVDLSSLALNRGHFNESLLTQIKNASLATRPDPYPSQSDAPSRSGAMSYLSDYGSLISPLSSVTYPVPSQAKQNYDPFYDFDGVDNDQNDQSDASPTENYSDSIASHHVNSGYVDAP